MTMLVKLGFQNSETLIFIYYIQEPMISHEIIGNLTVGMNTILCAAIERRGVISGIGLLQ